MKKNWKRLIKKNLELKKGKSIKHKGKTLTEYTNPFSPNNFKKNDDIILNYFMSNI